MDLSQLSTAINCVLQDLKDKQFISSVKKQFDSFSPDEKKDPNIAEVLKWFNIIIQRNISEQSEAIYELSSLEIDDDLRSLVDDETSYTKKFKSDFVAKLSVAASISSLKPNLERLNGMADKILLLNGKRAIDMLYELYEGIDDLQKLAYKTKTMSSSGNIVIIDPIENTTHDTMGPVLEELKQAATNKIKSIPVIDDMVGGGFAPKTFNLFGAIGGNGKSLTLQNILLYASKNNDRSIFDLEAGLKPCLLFVSLELSKKQCFQRQLAWCGVTVADSDLEKLTETEMEHMIMDQANKTGFKLPIIYIERIQGEWYTSINEIESECDNLINMGFQPVMIAIDYLDRLEVNSTRHKQLGMTGADGSALLRQKGAECRELGFRRNCPVISAAQLNGEAQSEMNKVEAYLRSIDIVHHFGTGMLAGSKQLQTETDTIVFQHKIEIENKTQEGEVIETTEFIAMSVMKDRDGHSTYKLSVRDKENEIQYKKQTQKIRNTALGELLKDTTRIHAVVPLHKFRLDESDYARSIRMFYPTDKTEFVCLTDLIGNATGNNPYGYDDDDGPLDPVPVGVEARMDAIANI